jgi:hypothetical protein
VILSLPIGAWLLLVVAVGLGLGLEVAFYLRHTKRRTGRVDGWSGGQPGEAERPPGEAGRPNPPRSRGPGA